jgi:hypothetical protein
MLDDWSKGSIPWWFFLTRRWPDKGDVLYTLSTYTINPSFDANATEKEKTLPYIDNRYAKDWKRSEEKPHPKP